MAEVTIYHNPRCSKSRQALALLRDAGVEPEIVEYLSTPLDADEIEDLFARLKLDDVRAAVRKGEAPYRELRLDAKSREEIIAAVAAYPILLERPIVEGPKGVAVCRPPEIATSLI